LTLLVTVVTPLRDGTQKDDCTRHLVKGKGWVIALDTAGNSRHTIERWYTEG